MNAVENTFFNVWIVPLQTAKERFDFLPLGTAAAIVADGTVLRKAAGTLDELQLICTR